MIVDDLIGELIEANWHIGEVRRRLRDRSDIEPLDAETACVIDELLARAMEETVAAQKTIKASVG